MPEDATNSQSEPVPVFVSQTEPIAGTVVPPPKKPGRIRRNGPLRLIVFFFVLSLVYGLSAAAIYGLVVPHVDKALSGAFALAGTAVGSLLMIGVYLLLVRWLEKRPVAELSLKRAPQLVGGIVLAVVLFCVVYAVYFGLGAASWKGYGTTAGLLMMATIALLSGVCEELTMRGGVYRIMEDMFGSGVALAFSGLLFGAMHLGNPHASLLAAFAIAIEAGILLAAAYAVTRNLWFPIGIHMGWNFAEGGIFGASVSGGKPLKGLFDIPLHGPDWLTGGGFGPEASVVPMVICTLAGIYFVIRMVRKGDWRPLRFRMTLD